MVAFPKGYDSGEQVAKPAQAILTGFALIFIPPVDQLNKRCYDPRPVKWSPPPRGKDSASKWRNRLKAN